MDAVQLVDINTQTSPCYGQLRNQKSAYTATAIGCRRQGRGARDGTIFYTI